MSLSEIIPQDWLLYLKTIEANVFEILQDLNIKPDLIMAALICLGMGLAIYGTMLTLSSISFKINRRKKLSDIIAVDQITKSQPIENLTFWIEQSENRLPSNIKPKLPIIILALAVFILGYMMFKNPVPAFLMAVIIMIIPGQITHNIQQKHRGQVEEQLTRAIRIFASEFSITPQLEKSFAAVARTVEDPVGGIFQKAYNRLTYRHNIDVVLADMAASLNTVHGHIFVHLLQATRKHGKTITPLFHELVSKITVTQELSKKSKGELSGERILSLMMAFSPLPIYIVLNKITPNTQEFIQQTIAGRFVVIASFTSAIIWMMMDRLMGHRPQG